MGDMADMFLSQVCEYESMRDDYVSGGMSLQDAYGNRFIDEMGCEPISMQEAWDRASIGSSNSLDNELEVGTAKFDLASSIQKEVLPSFNKSAKNNLYKQCPTCNHCQEEMSTQFGKFGKFYYCGNRCKGQSTVSDKYWQSVCKYKG